MRNFSLYCRSRFGRIWPEIMNGINGYQQGSHGRFTKFTAAGMNAFQVPSNATLDKVKKPTIYTGSIDVEIVADVISQ